ncbi:PKD-like domain-containing protein [Polluticoccus soli]|uniref:PKD-like domain-containing protein n=1 Tax=Polluticoccus soli TaxID=3034150 RepID=UPI0023E30BD8|nr:PKD-like domain-containing protein [Flavipsychrobacter sp. JY13-12]
MRSLYKLLLATFIASLSMFAPPANAQTYCPGANFSGNILAGSLLTDGDYTTAGSMTTNGGQVTFTWSNRVVISKVAFHYGSVPMTGCNVDYWNGSSWVNITHVTASNTTADSVSFTPVTTTQLRFSSVTGASAPNFKELRPFSPIYGIDPTTCGGVGSMKFPGLSPNTSYSVHFTGDASGSPQFISTDASGVLTIVSNPGINSNLTAGTYSNFYCFDGPSDPITFSGNVVLSNPPAPIAYTVSGSGSYCSSGSGLAVFLSNSQTGVNYQLKLDGVNTGSAVAGSTGNFINFGLKTAGVYTVVATDATTTCSASMTSSATITANPSPTITLGADPTVIQGNTNAQLFYSATTGSPTAYSITWSAAGLAAGFTNVPYGTSLTSTSLNIAIPAAAPVGSYTGTMRVANGSCESADQNFTINIVANSIPSFISGATTTLAVCKDAGPTSIGSQLAVNDLNTAQSLYFSFPSLPAHGGLGASIYGTATNGGILTPAFIEYTPTPGYTGPDAFTVVVNDGLATDTITVNVTVNNSPTAFNVIGGGAYCAGGSGVVVGLSNSTTDVSYQLKVDGLDVGSPVAGSTGLGINFGPKTAAGNYTVVATNNTTNCTATMTGSVNVTVNPVPTITLGTSPTINGGTTANLPYTATTGSPTTYTITYDATALGAGFANVSATSLPSSPITLTLPTPVAAATYNGNIRVSDGTCQSTLVPFSVTVTNSAPSFTGGATQTLLACQDLPNYIMNSQMRVDDADAGQTLTWSVVSAPAHGTANATYTTTSTGSTITPTGLTYTPDAGYSGSDVFTVQVSDGTATATTTINVTVRPAPAADPVSDQTVCNNSATTAITFSNPLGAATYFWAASPAIGLAANGTGNIPSFTATNTGTTPVTGFMAVTPLYGNGCSGLSRSFKIIVNPTPTVNAVSNQTLCHMATTTAVNFSGAVSGTTYNWTNSNNFISLAPVGTGNINAFTITNTASSPVTATITVTPTKSGCTGTAGSFSFTVNPQPITNTSSIPDQALCHNGTSTAVSFTGYVPGATYNWTNDNTSIGLGASGTGDIASFTATNSGTTAAVATITVTPTKSGCTGAAKTFTITANPTPTVNTVSNQTLCNNGSTTAVAFSGAVSSTTYNWTNDNASIGLAASGTGDIVSFTATNSGTTAAVATITVTPTKNGCPGTAKTFTITANPTPTVNTVSNQSVCNNGTTTAVAFSGAVSSTTYNWTNTNTSIGLAASGTGDIASFTATNSGTTPVSATITVTPTKNGCSGTAKTFTITVNPTPTVNTISNQTLCNNASTTAVNFSGAVSGTTYSWVNSHTSIGLAGSGLGNIAAFTATNSNATAVTAMITVVPAANGCLGSSKSYSVTVKPTPTVNTVSNQTVCNNTITDASFSGTVAGTTYSWTNNLTFIGLAASGSGSIASFTATNTSNSPVTATITVTPAANGCTGIAGNFNITVNPTATVNTVSNQPVCNNATTTAVNFTSGVSGTTYSWTNTNNTIGLAATGAGNIAAFQAINAGTSPVAGTINVIPTANGCAGTPASFTYTVNPTPTVDAVASQTLCNDDVTTGVGFIGAVSPTIFSWTNNTPSIGLAAIGANYIPGFVATNATSAPVTATIDVTPLANGCAGTSRSFDITVNPTPTVSNIISQAVCNGSVTNDIVFTSPVAGSSFAWVNNNTSIGIGANGVWNIGPFTAVNSGTAPDTATISVTPTANGCVGVVKDFTITVNPTPMLTSTLTPAAICDNNAFNYTPASATTGTTFTWSRTATPGISNAAANGTSNPAETLHNITVNPVTTQYVYTQTANGCSHSENVNLVVNPTPRLNSPLTATLCSDEEFNYTPTSLTTGTIFSWNRTNEAGITPANGNGNGAISETLTNRNNGTTTILYVYTAMANGCSNTEKVTLTMHNRPHEPVIAVKAPELVCANTMYQNFGAATAAPAGTFYTWTADNATIWSQGDGHQNALVNFPASGISTVTLTTTLSATGCDTSTTVAVQTGSSKAQQPEVMYYNGRFVCLQNDMDVYIWGYDDKGTLDSTVVPKETNQDYLNLSPDFTNKYYWVMTMKNGCAQKTYYNAPTSVERPVATRTEMRVYPNPATETVNFELSAMHGAEISFSVYDVTGKLLQTVPATAGRAQANVSALAQGMYSVICTVDGAKIAVAKFVKQ